MKVVLLSGGSGKRLYPLSSDHRPKQFLRVINDGGKKISMIQNVWKKIRAFVDKDDTVIATSKLQSDIIQNQIGNEVKLVIEPNQRDTYPAIVLACSYLHSELKADENEEVIVLPVDSYAEDAFYHKVLELAKAVRETDYDLVLIGIRPTSYSTQYGYIVPSSESSGSVIKVDRFQEKPPLADLFQLIEKENAYWNCGVFGFKLKFIKQHVENKGLKFDYNFLREHYDTLEKISFDYAVVQNCKNIGLIEFEGQWKDLGTWSSLTSQLDTNIVGPGLVEKSSNTHVVNELQIPVYALGLENVVVAASPNGILVADKDCADAWVKDLANRVVNKRPMYEERRWGWYRVLEHYQTEDGQEVLVKRLQLLPGKCLSYQRHSKRKEIWTIVKGTGTFVKNTEFMKVYPGMVLTVEVGDWHALKADDHCELEFIEVQMGSELVEEDIERKFLDWDSIMILLQDSNQSMK